MRPNNEPINLILKYLKKNPDAGDTLLGIVAWWLASTQIDRAADEVSNAINNLVDQGLIVKKKIKGRNSICSRSRSS